MPKFSEDPKISVVVPVYNEQDLVRPFLARLVPALEKIGSYEVIFCADPSPDGTEQEIEKEIKTNPRIGMLVMSRRFGQPPATMAGLLNASGQMCAVIDIDLQDPPELIPEMAQKIAEGYEVVVAKRRSREGETAIKLLISDIGYRLINAVSEVRIPRDTGDFRIVTRRVIEELRKLKESHGFLRGLVSFVGFRQTFIEYDRPARASGTGNYNPFTGSLKIGLNGLICFSNYPLGFLFAAGAFFSLAGAVALLLGASALAAAVLFMGGVQLMGLGVLGQYIGRIYDDVKGRPQYIVDRAVNLKLRS